MKTTVAGPIVSLLLATNVLGADWPMYRADAARSGYTAHSLPDALELSWTRKAQHPPMRAWPSRDRLKYDCAYQPVVGGDTLYIGSSADCKIYALDAASTAHEITSANLAHWLLLEGRPFS